MEIHNKVVYRVHHRVANRWRDRRAFLMGDAAHLITPMWALGLNTGVLDASNLPWRLAWHLRGWAPEALLDGYEREQKPLAAHGSGEMAEAARAYMAKRVEHAAAMTDNNWSNAYTRGLLGVRLDANGAGDWSLVKSETEPAIGIGDRLPDALVHGPDGREQRLHDLCGDRFVALYFADARRRPAVPGGPVARARALSSFRAGTRRSTRGCASARCSIPAIACSAGSRCRRARSCSSARTNTSRRSHRWRRGSAPPSTSGRSACRRRGEPMAMSATYDFSGSVVLVSGGASGIGAATARACAERGARVLVVDVDEARASGDQPRPGDRDAPGRRRGRAARSPRSSRGMDRIDAAVLCAAIQRRTPIDAITDEEWRRHMAVNLDGVFHFVRAVVPLMRRQRSGAILAFTSGLVNMGWPGASAYAASKGALIGLIKCVAQELRPYGVRANVLSPGSWRRRCSWTSRPRTRSRCTASRSASPSPRTSYRLFSTSSPTRPESSPER